MGNAMKFDESKDVPRIRDVELGHFLGMAKPVDIRRNIAKYIREEKLNDFDVIARRATVETFGRKGQYAGKPVNEFWLTEEAALFVAGRSESPNGTRIMRALIAAFEELRRQSGAVSHILQHYFNDAPAQLKERMFPPLIRAILRIKGEPEIGNPAWGPLLASLVYGWALKADGQQEHRRKLNPTPNGSKVDYVWLSGEGLDACKHVIQTGIDLTRSFDTWESWKYNMELIFGDKELQLFLNPFARQSRRLPPKRKPSVDRHTEP